MGDSTPMDPRQRAWLNSFLDENHLNYTTSPDLVASPAQLQFMLHLEPDQPYYPCSELLFNEIMARVKSPVLGEQYNDVWSRIFGLVREKIDNKELADYLVDLLNIKFQHETTNYNMIPSRVEKRLYKLFIVTTQIEDPLMEEKIARNARGAEIVKSDAFIKAINQELGSREAAACSDSASLEDRRRAIDSVKLRRLFQAGVHSRFWTEENQKPSSLELTRIFETPITGNGWKPLIDFLLTPDVRLFGHWVPRKILYLADRAGEIMFDLAVAKFLVRLGHTVIMAVKNAAFYDLVYLGDVLNDPVLKQEVNGAEVITDSKLTKNDLAARMRNDMRLKIITDGTMEKLNLARTSVTFARVFKEADGVISKGTDQRGRFLESRFEFVNNVFSLAADEGGRLSVMMKPHSAGAVRFTTADLEDQAEKIIAEMREASEKGWTVMFYSGIVGSIPGETDTAIQVMTTFVDRLKNQQSNTFIINPSAYFIKGMDADDLMYMWEIVQRSGLIDIWRFQTYQDIEKSFALMSRKVPPQWVGKDSTYSTGCTKEMAIALDVQRRNPEMQIIGPDPERFSRRGEYGIGLFHDQRLSELYD